VDDVVSLADLQRFAHVDPHFDDIPDRQCIVSEIFEQRRQKLHPDIDIPAELVLQLLDLMIFETDDIAVPSQLGHQNELGYDILHHALKVCRDAFLTHAFMPRDGHFCFLLRYSYDLERGVIRVSEFFAFDLIYFSEGTFADKLDNGPFIPAISDVHDFALFSSVSYFFGN